MKQLASALTGLAIDATDGDIGSVADLLFDDEHWTVRSLVIDTGSWLPGRKVVLSCSCLGDADPASGTLRVPLSREKIENSPGLDAHAPVSRQREIEIHDYYGAAPYWAGGVPYPRGAYPGVPGMYQQPMGAPGYEAGLGSAAMPAPIANELRDRAKRRGDPHLRSAAHVTVFAIEARDGDIGHAEDFVI